MAIGAKLQLRQSQSLVMTPQLMQSIRLLQFSHLELENLIDEEVQKNPLLERAGSDDEEPSEKADQGSIQDASRTGVDRMFETGNVSAESMSEQFDTSMENVFPDDPGTSFNFAPELSSQWKLTQSTSGSESFDIGEVAAAQITMGEQVNEQIAFAFRDPSQKLIAHELADALDEAGYMRGDISEIAERLGTDQAEILSILSVCQTFDPPGLFARDLSECLAIQLRARDRLDPAMQAMVNNLDLLAKRDFAQLRRLCGVNDEDLVEMLAEIRALDPRPGLSFTVGTADTIVPDVLVRQLPDGSWNVELNPDTLPKVLVNQNYFSIVSKHTDNQEEKDFLNECLQNANWLARSLDQRAKTIVKVATEIVKQQENFFLYGIRHLRPLNLRTVADAISMHESTVSRVTANKYMMTPRGLFELRYFFTAAIASAEGSDAHSSEAVRDRIRALIDAEKVENVLSDDTIVDILKKDGVDIARRTVAKYREAMSIASSVQRRREKRAKVAAGQ